jgi:hypothetical protein
MKILAEWQNFYVIMGSSAGALIGLQFVVMSLIAGLPIVDPAAGRAFATPTVIHFGTVLLLAAILSAPWDGIAAPTILSGVVGLCGLIYAMIVTRRMRHTSYKPQFEDWLFHSLLPFAAYITLAVSAYAAQSDLHEALFGVAAAVVLLLFIGIHNAWDAVTYHIFESKQRQQGGEPDL